jgi:hypothetical protein
MLEIDPKELKHFSGLTQGVRYSTANPSFRVNLNCSK